MIAVLLSDWAPTPASGPYWEAAADGRLVVQRCTQCKRVQHPPRVICSHCAAPDPAFEPTSGDGVVYSFTIVRRGLLPQLRDVVPYVLAIIELPEGVRLMSIVRGCPPEDVEIGMRVVVDFERVGDVALPVFRPAG